MPGDLPWENELREAQAKLKILKEEAAFAETMKKVRAIAKAERRAARKKEKREDQKWALAQRREWFFDVRNEGLWNA